MRALAFALVVGALLLVSSAGAAPPGLKLLTRDDNKLALVYLDRPAPFTQPLSRKLAGTLAFSGDGRLLSIGGMIVGRKKLPTRMLAWAPIGERAAYVNTQGGVVEWTPAGLHRLEPNGWGATSWAGLAWSGNGALAVARGDELWVIRSGAARRVVGPLPANTGTGGPDIPEPFAWVGNHVLWWRWPGSGSIAADGVDLYLDRTKLGTTLMYPDYVAVCGSHLAYAAGLDRESTDNKKLFFDGRDVSGSPHHSWSTPACTASGRLVAAASRNDPNAFRAPHRSIWQILPTRVQLTRPPAGWSDEDPRLFANGDLLFVRTRVTSKKTTNSWSITQTGKVMLLARGKLEQLTAIGFTEDELSSAFPIAYYGHYDWSHNLAVYP